MKAILTVSFNGALGQVSRSSMAAAARRWGTREQPVLFIIVSEPNAHVAATGVTRVARWEVWQSYPDLRPPEPPGAHSTTSLENLPQTPLGPASMKTEAFEILDLVEAQWLASQRAPCWSCGGPRHREQEPHQVLIIDADTVVSSVCPDPFAEFQMQHPTTMAGARRPLTIEIPGVYLRYSPMLPSPRSPISSRTTTFLMFGEVFCSFTAAAAALSAVDSTTKRSSLTRSFSEGGWLPTNARSKSWCAVVPAVTVTAADLESIPA